jgi:glutamate synthase domain-containing protein 2
VVHRVDGEFRSGLDVLLTAAVGAADEYGFGSIAMIATGCVMAHICHTNNCPVGGTSQVITEHCHFVIIFFFVIIPFVDLCSSSYT